MSVQCDCPFCPLTEANTQICDFKVSLLKQGAKLNHEKLDTFSEDVKRSLVLLVLIARNNNKIKPGLTHSHNTEMYDYHVECISRIKFKVCFHAKPKQVVEEEENPC